MKRIFILTFLAAFAVGSIPKPDTEIADLMTQWQNEYGGGWWPWGLNALDLEGDGDIDLVVTQHNGGSRVLKQTDSGWEWANVGSNLGGTFRPYILDFNSDGGNDILFRDSLPNTAFVNTGGKFQNAGFAYGTGNDPIKEITPTYFGHDWGRWLLPGFQPIAYTNPNYGKLPPGIKAEIGNNLGKQFFRAWFHESADLVCVSGFWSYHKDENYCRFLRPRRNQLIDVTAAMELPTVGACVHAQDFNGDGKAELLIVGAGYYVSGPKGYTRAAGILSDFLSATADWPHQVFVSGNRLVVSNVRGQTVKVFQNIGGGAFGLAETVWGWDGEAVALGDFNGDGSEDIAVGRQLGGGKYDIHFLWN